MSLSQKIPQIKRWFCTVIGILGGWITHLVGGWTPGLGALLVCMGVDFVTGLIVAGVFHASIKSPMGGIDSRVCFKGLCRKFEIFAIIVVCNQLDILAGTSYIRDAMVIGFGVNEIISILENAALMGLPVPKFLTEILDQLKDKANGGKTDEWNGTDTGSGKGGA